jgi:hypothetical protein
LIMLKIDRFLDSHAGSEERALLWRSAENSMP